jgi:hypothetical protein
MKLLLLALALAAPASEPPLLHASASCTPANKPGRIRCRAVLELPLDQTSKKKIAWSEVRVVSSDPSVTPLRGRLGPLDAETRDDARVVWSFSVAAEGFGDRTMRVRLLATLESKPQGTPVLVDQALDVAVRVTP